ncbi:hypothetical protein Btru_051042 [Bulinus truncatus]|nr:hypothetical protein Btru_051042 [Bulinus truncatus]
MGSKELISEAVESVELTEQVVLFRTRASDLESIKKLNCWGSNISDAKIIRRMPNLEVCSLSVNKLTTLRDFAHCYNLKELYVRTNNIQTLGDIHYLKNLPKLRSLWLSENPCTATDNYRMTVLRTLPRLQKLDNIVVSSEEISRATLEGDNLPVPEDFSYSGVFIDSTSSSTEEDKDGNRSRSSSESSEKWALPRRKRHQKKRDDLMKERMSYEDGGLMSVDSRGDCAPSRGAEEETSPRTDESCADADDKDVGTEKCENSRGCNADLQESRSINYNFNCNMDTLTSGSANIDNLKGESLDLAYNVSCNSVQMNIESVTDSVNSEIPEVDPPKILKNEIKQEDKNKTIESDSVPKIGIDNSLTVTSTESEKTDNSDKITSSSFLMCDEATLSGITPPTAAQGFGQKLSQDLGDAPSQTKNNENENRKCSLLDQIRLDDSLNISELNEDLAAEQNFINRFETTTASELGSYVSTVKSGFGKESKEPVNWKEYNRLRQEIGVKPMEPPPMTSRLMNNDIVKTRNSNILQAVLSLVKELDKDSLDIVSNAVQARLDGL